MQNNPRQNRTWSRNPAFRILILCWFSIAGASVANVARAEDSAQRLAAEVGRLNDWITQSPDAEQWRIYLDLNALETLVGRGYRADVNELARIQSLFQQDSPALAHPNFRSVTQALARHIAQIQAANQAYPASQFNADSPEVWANAFEAAAEKLQPMTSQQLNAIREDALQQILTLDRYLNERGALPVDQLNKTLSLFLPAADSEAKTEEQDAEENKDESNGGQSELTSNEAFDLTPIIKLLQQPVVLEWEEEAKQKAAEGANGETKDSDETNDSDDSEEGDAGEEQESDTSTMLRPRRISSERSLGYAARIGDAGDVQSLAAFPSAVSRGQQTSGNRPATFFGEIERRGQDDDGNDQRSDASDQDNENSEEDSPLSPTEILLGLRDLQAELNNFARQDPNPYVQLAVMKLQDYQRTLLLGRRENLAELLQPQIQKLTELLPEWKANGLRTKQIETIRIIGFLEAINQAEDLVAAFKRTYWRNNAVISVSESLINRFATRPVENSQPVNEKILDNQVYGVAKTKGQVKIDFVPNALQAHLSLHLTGNLESNNYTQKGPVTVYADSQAPIEARRSIYLNGGGWYQKSPYGAVNLASFFKGTSCGNLIDRIAQKQFELQREGATAIAARRAQQRLLTQFNNETGEALANGRTQAQTGRDNSIAFKPFRPTFYVLTSEHFLQAYANRYGNSQLTAFAQPPAMTVPSDLALQVHESLLNNYLEDELSGITITDADLDRLSTQFPGKADNDSQRQPSPAGNSEADPVPNTPDPKTVAEQRRATSLRIGDQDSDQADDSQTDDAENEDDAPAPRQPFEMVLETTRPIDLQFQDERILLTANIGSFETQGNSIQRVQVRVQFKMHYDSIGTPGIRLEQIGRVEANLIDPDDIDLNSATILAEIEKTINAELKRQRSSQSERGIKLPLNLIDRNQIEALRDLEGAEALDQARLVVLSFTDGWASLAWRFAEQNQASSTSFSISDQGATSSLAFPSTLTAVASEPEFLALVKELSEAKPDVAPEESPDSEPQR